MKKATSTANDEVTATEGHAEFKKILGSDFKLAKVITKETIEACETMLEEAVSDFFTDERPDLDALLPLAKTPADQINVAPARETILKHTFNIKSHAKMLGFTLITDICGHIVNTMNSQKLNDKKRQKIVGQLIEGLKVAFDHKIRDDGGPVGAALRQRLEKAL